ncbi:MAG TPA: alpha/beta hydrolase family protein [Acidobacteriota bacterium]|nr:alpha/beta hydrolase family protein [Acidobacteriota bacterium]
MNRRTFLTTSSAVLAATSNTASAAPEALPTRQERPLADLGSHWTNVFEKLSARCKPKLSFLQDEFSDPKAWCERARSVLLAGFHYSPDKCDPRPEIRDRTDCGEYFREHVTINTTPDIRASAYLLIPKKNNGKSPGIVALHDHGGFYFWGKEKLVEVTPEHPELTRYKSTYYGGRSIADELARQGFVVLVPDMLHWGERGLYLEADPPRIREKTLDVTRDEVEQFNQRSWAHEELISRTALTCGVTWSGIIVWDDLRMTDYLLTRPEVDAGRIGCIGLSLGSVRSIYLGALHPAVRASVPVCWMAEYQGMARNHVRNGIGFTKLVPGLYTDLDWPDLAALHWPGSLMTINGLKDTLYPLEAAQRAVEKVRRLFAKMGAPGRYEGVFFDGPHEFNREMQERAFEWLKKELMS